MTDEQAEELKQDPRVWDVDLRPEDKGIYPKRCATHTDDQVPRNLEGTFWKGGGELILQLIIHGVYHIPLILLVCIEVRDSLDQVGGSYDQLCCNHIC